MTSDRCYEDKMKGSVGSGRLWCREEPSELRCKGWEGTRSGSQNGKGILGRGHSPCKKSEGGTILPCLLGTKHDRWTLKPLHMWCPLPGALFLWFFMLRPRFLQEAFLDYHSPFLGWVLPLGSPSRCFSREALGHTSASLTCLPCKGGGQALSTSPNIPCAHMVPAHSRSSRRVCR